MPVNSMATTAWSQTGESALQAKKFAFARDAFQRAGDETKILEAKKSLDQTLGSP